MKLTIEYNIETPDDLIRFIKENFHTDIYKEIFGVGWRTREVIAGYILDEYDYDTTAMDFLGNVLKDRRIPEIQEISLFGEVIDKYPFMEPEEIEKIKAKLV